MKTLKATFAHHSVIVKMMMWLGVMVGCTLVAIGVWKIVCGDLYSTTGLKWFQAIQTCGTLLLPPLIGAWLWSDKPLQWLHLERCPKVWPLVLSIGIIAVASPGINLMGYINQQFTLPAFMGGVEAWMQAQEAAAAAMTERFLAADSIGILMVNILLMALLPALSEELTFRGAFQGLLSSGTSRTPHLAIWATAILFSAIHCQFYGFIPRMLMGALFGYAVVWHGNLWLAIAMHFVNNAVAVVGYYVAQKQQWDTEVLETFGTGDTLWVGISSLVIVGIGICILRIISKKKCE